jgi:hypothetical protein
MLALTVTEGLLWTSAALTATISKYQLPALRSPTTWVSMPTVLMSIVCVIALALVP